MEEHEKTQDLFTHNSCDEERATNGSFLSRCPQQQVAIPGGIHLGLLPSAEGLHIFAGFLVDSEGSPTAWGKDRDPDLMAAGATSTEVIELHKKKKKKNCHTGR